MENFKKNLIQVYGNDEHVINRQHKRYAKLIQLFSSEFDSGNYHLFSTPGRSEISGNHTDHNHGKVIAGSINVDSIAIAAPNNSSNINIISEGYDEKFIVDIKDLKPVVNERESTHALVRGITYRFKELGYNINGFNAVLTSDVLEGSGLSSSASVEVLLGSIFNHLFNCGKINYKELAAIGQYAENNYFGKPCGLMDQVACAAGGMVAIDFEYLDKPNINKLEFDFSKTGYSLLVVDTGSNHTDLTSDYAAIPTEMKSVAKILGKEYLRQIDEEVFYRQIKHLRSSVSDRAILRALHFFEENKRVEMQIKALQKDDFITFLKLVEESGDSSFKYLQNVFAASNPDEQALSLALALSNVFLKNHGAGACRVHGGGYAGTIQVFLPNNLIPEYKSLMNHAFCNDVVKVLSIRKHGAVCLTKL